MSSEPYASARRVFLVADNGPIHRGQKAIDRLATRWPNLILVHTPIHASWLNQIEIYFSILGRKALKPTHFRSLDELKDRVFGLPRALSPRRPALRLDLHPRRPA